MPSTFSTNLAIELIGTGDQAGAWGNTTNTNLGTLIEQAISGYVTQAVATGTDTTITIPDGSSGVARNMYIELTGTGGTNTNLIVPAKKKLYFIYNNTSSGQVTVKVSGQTGISVPNGVKTVLVCNGTDIVDATSFANTISANISTLTVGSLTATTLIATSSNITTLTGTNFSATSLTLGNALRVSQGGTGTSLTPSNGQLLIGNGTGYALSTLTAGPGVAISNAAGSITITASGSGLVSSVSATSPLQATAGSSVTISIASAIPVSLGGTGQTSAPTNGQLLIGNGSSFVLSTLTAGTGISVTNSSGSITIAASGGGLPVVTVTTSTAISAVAGTNYVLSGASATVTLPASPTISDTIYVTVANSLTVNKIARNGKPIQGLAEDMILNAPYASAQLRFTNDTIGWVMV